MYMNRSSNKLLKNFVVYLLLPFAIVKLIYTVVAFLFLSKDDIVSKNPQNLSYHYSLNLSGKILETGSRKPVIAQVQASNRIKDVKLKGTYIEGDNSFIVIEDRLGTTFLHKDEKYAGYTLIEIYDNRAVFDKNGVHYDVVIDEEDNSKRRSPPIASVNSQNIDHGEMESFEPAVISHQDVDSYIKDPNKIWKNIRIQELRKNGKIDGFRVNYVKKGSFFDTAGLKSGDVIKGIDGNEIKSLSDVMKYYNNINNLDGLTLSILRGDSEIELEFSIN